MFGPQEIKLEWGKGLAQKREAEAKFQAIEEEKNKPFARSRYNIYKCHSNLAGNANRIHKAILLNLDFINSSFVHLFDDFCSSINISFLSHRLDAFLHYVNISLRL